MWREGEVRGGETRFFVRAPHAGKRDPFAAPADEDDRLALLLHGWPQDGTCWRSVAPALADAGYRVVCPDLKGFGRSDAPRRGYDPATLADEISQLIRALGGRKALLVGHDWGGAVALATAFRHPGRVRALVSVSSPFRQIDLTAAWHIPLLNVPLLPELAFRFAARPLTRGALRYASEVDGVFGDAEVARYAGAVASAPRGWLSYYRTLSRRAVVDGAVRTIRRRVPLLPSPAGPHRLRVPATVVWGARDRITPPHLAPGVAEDLDAALVLVPGAGHFVPEEAPEPLVRAVLDLAGPADGRDGEVRGQRRSS